MQCIAQLLGLNGEFGSLDYSPISFSEIRERQEWNEQPLELGPLRYGYVCQRGYYPEDVSKENQDSFVTVANLGGVQGTLMVGVFDGHGEYGDDCSGFARDNIEAFLCAARKEAGGDLAAALRATYLRLNAEMHATKEFDDELSGTTAVVAVIEDGVCWIANVGDSRAIIGQSVNGALVPRALSKDQTPMDAAERKRVLAFGCEIASAGQRRRKELPPDSFWDALASAEDDPADENKAKPQPKIWAAGANAPGCSFTRSLGDMAGERLGVNADAEISSKQLCANDRFVCLASDGVWEFLSNERVCQLLGEQLADPLAACRAVVAESYRMWLQFDTRTDDITCLLLSPAELQPEEGEPRANAPTFEATFRFVEEGVAPAPQEAASPATLLPEATAVPVAAAGPVETPKGGKSRFSFTGKKKG